MASKSCWLWATCPPPGHAQAPPCQAGCAALWNLACLDQGEARLILCLQRPGPRGPCDRRCPARPWNLSLNGPLPESSQPLSPLRPSSSCPRLACICIRVPNTQELLKGRATPGTQWLVQGVAQSGDKAGKGKEGGSFSNHHPICSSSEPLRLCDPLSFLLRARPDKYP